MREPLKVFIGYDPQEPIALHVLAHSILRRASCPVEIAPLVQAQLRAQGVYTRERGPTESTEFSLTRFLVPYLSGFHGWSVFMDCDMLCRVDLAFLQAAEMGIGDDLVREIDKTVLVCQHSYEPQPGAKFLGHAQTVYPRKNWSSFMVFNNARCRALSPAYVNAATGLELHRFLWTTDDAIGALPLEWNWLVGEYPANPRAKILHYTLGGPWFRDYAHGDHATDWFAEYREMLTPPVEHFAAEAWRRANREAAD